MHNSFSCVHVYFVCVSVYVFTTYHVTHFAVLRHACDGKTIVSTLV